MADPTSDTTVPSSPRPNQAALLSSDAPFRSSSPPSSPPTTFAWENTPSSPTSYKPLPPSPPPRRITAFSILGKRRPALTQTSANPRPTKQQKRQKDPSPPSGLEQPRKPRPLTQLQISLGQSTRKTCPTCAMEFVPSLPEDARLHAQYHRDRLSGRGVGRGFVAQTQEDKLFRGVREGDAIVRVDGRDAGPRRRVAEGVLGLVQGELGAVALREGEGEEGIWGKGGDGRVGYLYVRERRVVGFLLVEGLRGAFRVVEGEKKEREEKGGREEGGKAGSALEALRARRQAARRVEAEVEKRALELSKTEDAVRLGVSRVWTLGACRGGGIAVSMLDTALRDQGIEDKMQVAFSQPTQAGARLARRWMGVAYGWHVYA